MEPMNMMEPFPTTVPDSSFLASSTVSTSEELLHLSQVTELHQQPNPPSLATPHPQEHTAIDGVLKEEIIKLALSFPGTNRHVRLPKYFSTDGRLRRPWRTCYETEIRMRRLEAKNVTAKLSSNTKELSSKDYAAPRNLGAAHGDSKKRLACRTQVGVEAGSSTVSNPRREKKAKLAKTSPNSMTPVSSIPNNGSDNLQHDRSQSLKSGRSATVDGASSSLTPRSPDPMKFSLPKAETTNSPIHLSSASVAPNPTKRRVARKDRKIGTSKRRIKAPRPNPPRDISEQQPLLQETDSLNTIQCRNDACPQKHFAEEHLGQDYLLSIQAAKDDIRKFGFWVCPPCARKVAPMSTGQEKRAEETTTLPLSIPKNMGTEWLDDSEIRDPLEELSRLVLEFTADAFRNPWPNPHARAHILNVPCIKDERPAGGPLTEPLVPVLRRLLRIEGGVSVAAMIRSLQVEPEHSLWISAILGLLLKEFIFNTELLFDNPSFCLLNLGYTPQEIARILQSTRLKTLSNPPVDFSSRLIARREAFVDQLNQTMMPLVGCNPEKTGDYKAMALVAEDLALKMSAYANNYVPIYPNTAEPLDAREHMVENGIGTGSGTVQYVLLTTMPGVKVEISDGKWRICSQAKVRLWPEVERNKRPLEDAD